MPILRFSFSPRRQRHASRRCRTAMVLRQGAMIRVFVKLLGVEFRCRVRSAVTHPQTP
jgi:hypothetical protein